MAAIDNELNRAINRVPKQAGAEERVAALLETISSYIEHYHGGAVEMVDYDGRTLRVRLLGACDGCELASSTLHGWVAGTVKQFFPELTNIEAV